MGFNLKMFFADLENVLSSDLTDERKLEILTLLVRDEKEYVKQCGQL